MKVLRFQELLEGNITIDDLSKKGKDSKIIGDLFVKKFKDEDLPNLKINGKDIRVVNGDEIIPEITDDSGKFDPLAAKGFFLVPAELEKIYKTHGRSYVRYDDVIEGEDGKTYKLNQVDIGEFKEKNKRSGVAGISERLMCVTLAYKQSVMKKGEKVIGDADFDIMKDKLNNYRRNIDTGVVEVDREFIDSNRSEWGHTVTSLSNRLYFKETKEVLGKRIKDSILDPEKKYVFYHNSVNRGTLGAIKEAFKVACKNSGVKININKWNPADIWAIEISEDSYIRKVIGSDDITIDELSDVISDLFDKKIVIGISLKKIGQNEKNEIVINRETKIPNYRFVGFKLAKDNLSTIGIDVIAQRVDKTRKFGYELTAITLRSSNAKNMVDISGEVKGKSAQHGKVGIAEINEILKRRSIGESYESIPFSKKGYYDEDEKWVEPLIKWDIEDIIEEIDAIRTHLDVEEASETTNKYSESRGALISKYQSMYLGWILQENNEVMDGKNKTLSDSIVEEMLRYALSISFTDKSGESHITPKFVRVVDEVETKGTYI